MKGLKRAHSASLPPQPGTDNIAGLRRGRQDRSVPDPSVSDSANHPTKNLSSLCGQQLRHRSLFVDDADREMLVRANPARSSKAKSNAPIRWDL